MEKQAVKKAEQCDGNINTDDCIQDSVEHRIKRFLTKLMFASKWMLIPFYLKLFWTILKLLYYFIVVGHLTNDEIISAMEDVDITMIANLVKMIIAGSYNSFVDKTHGQEGEQVSSGFLKVKIATSIMGISLVYVLKTFFQLYTTNENKCSAENVPYDFIWKLCILQGIIIITALIFALIDFMHSKYPPQH